MNIVIDQMFRTLFLRAPPTTNIQHLFQGICNRGDLHEIRRFHDEIICTDPYLHPKNVQAYSLFMGTIYCNLPEKGLVQPSPVERWFQGIATEIHSIY